MPTQPRRHQRLTKTVSSSIATSKATSDLALAYRALSRRLSSIHWRWPPWRRVNGWWALMIVMLTLVVVVVGCQTLTTHRHADYEHSHYWHVWADGHCHIGFGGDVNYNTDICR